MGEVMQVRKAGSLIVTRKRLESGVLCYELEARNTFDAENEVEHNVFEVSGDIVRLRLSDDTMQKLAQLLEENWETDKLIWDATKIPSVLIIAERPKTEANVMMPLVGTKSYNVLADWLLEAGVLDLEGIAEYEADGVAKLGTFRIINATKQMKGKPTAFDVLDVRDQMREVRFVVTLGNVAADAALDASEEFPPGQVPPFILNLPHPSGLNRKLNSKKARRDVVRKLQYLARLRRGKVE